MTVVLLSAALLLVLCSIHTFYGRHHGAIIVAPIRFEPPAIAPVVVRYIARRGQMDDKLVAVALIAAALRGEIVIDEEDRSFGRAVFTISKTRIVPHSGSPWVLCQPAVVGVGGENLENGLVTQLLNGRTAAAIAPVDADTPEGIMRQDALSAFRQHVKTVGEAWLHPNDFSQIITMLLLAVLAAIAATQAMALAVPLLAVGAGIYYISRIVTARCCSHSLKIWPMVRDMSGIAFIGGVIFLQIIENQHNLAQMRQAWAALAPQASITMIFALAGALVQGIATVLGQQYTAEGHTIANQALGFKKYLQTLTRRRRDVGTFREEDIRHFASYYPYAVALNVDEAWLNTLEILRQQPEHACPWYRGTGCLNGLAQRLTAALEVVPQRRHYPGLRL